MNPPLFHYPRIIAKGFISTMAESVARVLGFSSPSLARSYYFWQRVQSIRHPSWVEPLRWEKTIRIPLGMKMRVPFAEVHGMSLILGYGYEPELTSRIQAYLRPGDVFVDVGANMGYFTLLGSKLVGDVGKVLSFEPCISTSVRLTQNLQLNSITNVSIYSAALSDREGTSFLSIPPFFNNGVSTVRDVANDNKCLPVQLRCFDGISEAQSSKDRIRLFKIDTEGHELRVLQGMQNTLKSAKSVAIACELTPTLTSVPAIVTFLDNLGFRGEYFWCGKWHPIAADAKFPAQCNAWFVKNA